MNNKQQRLAIKCADIKPLEGRILVAPNKVRTYKDKGFESTPVDSEATDEAIVAGETEMIMKEVIRDVNYRFQTAVVLQKPEDETRFNIGDTIIYELGALQEFDLIKGVSTLRKYDAGYVTL